MIRTDRETAKLVKRFLQLGFINGKRNTHLVQWLIVEYLFSKGVIKNCAWFLDTLQYNSTFAVNAVWENGYHFYGFMDTKDSKFQVGNIRLKTVKLEETNECFWDIWFDFYTPGNENGKRSWFWTSHVFFRVWPGFWVSDEPNLDIEEE